MIKIAWGITGAGDILKETVDLMIELQKKYDVEIVPVLSKNGEMVLKMYKLHDRLVSSFPKIKVESGPNVPFIAGPLQAGAYKFMVVCPATANTTAKIAHGIADSLITNAVAQATKGGTQVYIYPVDQRMGSLTTKIPDGSRLTITVRKVDVDNANKLREIENITVLGHPREIEDVVKKCL